MRTPRSGARVTRAHTVASPDACLNALHRGRRCDACAACPTGAIRVDALPSLELARCAGCGLCVATCPTGAFRAGGPTAADVCDRGREGTRVELVCPARRERRETRAPGVDALVEVPCLASLSTELLVALAAEHGAVWLDDSGCAACALATSRSAIGRAAELARRTLAAWGRATALRSYERDGALLDERPHRVRDLGDARPRATRRQFLSLLRHRDPRVARSGAPDLLARALALLGAPVTGAPLPQERFGPIRVADACSACGACARICPTSALVATTSPSRFALELRTAACLGPACGLCLLACPAGAISIATSADAGWLARGHDTVIDRAVTPCEECHVPVASDAGDRLCASCRLRRDRRSSLLAEVFPGARAAAQR